MNDLTIHEDELEHDRILLEQNLQMQHPETSFRLSSADGDGDDQDHDELEYARHGSVPSPEFNFRDREPYAGGGADDTHSQLHMWSYRTTEDDEGVYPYGGQSLSTTGHHASAVTLTAGLAGARNRRGADVSLSGAEYDPERPIDAMIAGVEKLSMLATTEASKSKYSNITFDPLIVDSTAELDRVLQSGQQPPPSFRSREKSNSRSVRLHSPPRSLSPTSTDSEHERTINARPKLTDALRRVSFSPQRPRSPHSAPRASSSHFPKNNTSSQHRRQPASPLAHVTASFGSPSPLLYNEADEPTPKPMRRTASSSAQSSHPHNHNPSSGATSQPHLRVQPATPSSSHSKPPRGKVGDSKREYGSKSGSHRMHEEAGKGEYNREHEDLLRRPPSAPPVSRHVPNHRQATPLRKSSLKMAAGTPRFGKVQLPDVTGLTNAVESPAKIGLENGDYMSMAGLRMDEVAAREVEARLVRTLNSVQSRLEHLEEENSISRRRVRELEYELEECKREVVRERTRLLEETTELSGIIQAASVARALGKRSTKGKGKAKESATVTAANLSVAEERYREAVEEKKALEALITSLRSHLARLTSELSEHQAILMELRSLREKDAITLQDKLAEVDNLRNEVERLASEVEVLRGVVEEGLRERRRSGREVGIDASLRPEDRGMSVDENDERADIANAQVDTEESGVSDLEESRPDNNTNTVTNDDDPWSIDGSSRANTTANPLNNEGDAPGGISRADRTMRTDRASLGSSAPVLGLSTASNGSALTTRTNAARANTSVGGGEEGNSFLGEEQKSRIEAEIEERRSIRGSFEASRLSVSPRPRLNSPTLQRRATARTRVDDNSDDDQGSFIDLGRETRKRPTPATPPSHAELPPRAPAPTPFHAAESDGIPRQQVDEGQRRMRRTSAEDEPKVHETPFPQIRGEYLERLFFSAPEHDARTCKACTRQRRPANAHVLRGKRDDRDLDRCAGDSLEDDDDDSIGRLLPSRYDRFLNARRGKEQQLHRRASASNGRRDEGVEADDEGFADGSSEDARGAPAGRDKGKQRAVDFVGDTRAMAKIGNEAGAPPQTVVTKVIRELEDDFTHYKSIYCELADRYKEMDATSEVRRRNILAQHLKEVVDILEQKGDQIASLYDLLTFKDKPTSGSAVPSKTGQPTSHGRTSLWSRP